MTRGTGYQKATKRDKNAAGSLDTRWVSVEPEYLEQPAVNPFGKQNRQ